MLHFIISHLNLFNFLVSAFAFLVAIYGICYTHKFNRRRITLSSGTFFSDKIDPPIAWFKIHNISPVPITITDIKFFSDDFPVRPLVNYQPKQTFSTIDRQPMMAAKIPDIIPDYKYATPLDIPHYIQPYKTVEVGYYFESTYEDLPVQLSCEERIHHFQKTQSFLVHFSQVAD